MTNTERHHVGVSYAVDALTDAGYYVDFPERVRAPWSGDVPDMLIDGKRALVRVSHPVSRNITIRQAGRVYHYQRQTYAWNFHQHGRRDHTDLWVLVAVSGSGDYAVYVMPARRITGPTLSVLTTQLDQHWISRYRRDAVRVRRAA